MRPLRHTLALLLALLPCIVRAQQLRTVQARVTGGVIEGVVSAEDKVRTFLPSRTWH